MGRLYKVLSGTEIARKSRKKYAKKIQKIFQKPLDKILTPWYNMQAL